MLLKLTGNIGEIPRTLPRQLPANAAQLAYDCRLDDGGLSPVRDREFIASIDSPPPAGFKTFFKDGNDWLGWDDHVNVVRGPVAQERLYITGDGVPKLRVSSTEYPLALAKPSGALTAAAAGGGSDPVTTRVYVYTWVTGFAEESQPNPVSNEVTAPGDEDVTLSGFASTPSGRNITHQRIYRSQTGADGVTGFYLIEERAAGTGNYVDNNDPDEFGEVLPSLFYDTPPATMHGIIALPNGMMAALDGKTLLFSEPYKPHAWPERYRLELDYAGVALAAFGTSVAVLTTGHPYRAGGASPETMQLEKLELNAPCINPRGVVDLGYSAAYPSTDGLVVVTETGARVATNHLFSRDDWLVIDPETLVAAQYNGRYFASYAYTDVEGADQTGTFIIDLSGEQPTLIRSRLVAEALWFEIETGFLYLLDGGQNIWLWDAASQPAMLLTWRSKLFVTQPHNFGCILIEADGALTPSEIAALEANQAAIAAANADLMDDDSIGGEINGAALNEYAINGDALQSVGTVSQQCAVTVYADRQLIATIGQVNKTVRLPAGFMATLWEVEVQADLSVSRVTLATTPSELKQAA